MYLFYKEQTVYLSYDNREYCGKVLEVDPSGKLHFQTLAGENIVVASGDLYKFKAENSNLENVFHLTKKEE